MTPTKADAPEPGRRLNAAGLRRDLGLLEALTSHEAMTVGGLGVLQVAQQVGRDKGVVSRSLATLAEAGLVDRDTHTGLYRPGYRLYSLAAQTFEARLAHMALPYLRRAVRVLHETTHLCVLRGGSVLTLISQVSEYNFRGLGWEGVSVPALHTSSGRVLLSGWDRDDLRQWFEHHKAKEWSPGPPPGTAQQFPDELPVEHPQPGKHLVTDFDTLLREIDKIKQRGYATVDEEFEIGVVGVSAPVFDFRRNIVAAINVSAPKSRIGAHLDQAGRAAAKVAAALSRQAGYVPG